jgi:cytoskeletal protein RodZ
MLGVIFLAIALFQNSPSPAPTPAPTPENTPTTPSSSTTSASTSSTPSSKPKTTDTHQPLPVAVPETNDWDTGGGNNPPSTSKSYMPPVTSASEYAIVFDPPTNVRVAPDTSASTLCSVTAKTSIRLLGSEGNWYQTDICGGKMGYIHRSQVKF